MIRGGNPTCLGRGFLKMALGFVAGPDDEMGYDFKSSVDCLQRALPGFWRGDAALLGVFGTAKVNLGVLARGAVPCVVIKATPMPCGEGCGGTSYSDTSPFDF